MDLFDCVKQGRLTAAQELLVEGADIDAKDRNGMTALMTAVDCQNGPFVDLLIKRGAGLDLQDKYGQTALMLAAGRNMVQAVAALLAAGARTELVSKSGLTALGFATDNGNRASADLLRKAKAR
jgi:ankyrin repeat protein